MPATPSTRASEDLFQVQASEQGDGFKFHVRFQGKQWIYVVPTATFHDFNNFFRRLAEDFGTRLPRSVGLVDRTLGHRCFANRHQFEALQRSAEVMGRRQALLETGAPLTSEPLGVREARRGIMPL